MSLVALHSTVIAGTSLLIRLGFYVFFRWIPSGVIFKPMPYLWALNVLTCVGLYVLRREKVSPTSPRTKRRVSAKEARQLERKRTEDTLNATLDAEIAASLAPPARRSWLAEAVRWIVGSPTSRFRYSGLVVLNTLAILAMAEYVYSPKYFYGHEDLSFARVGHVTPTSVKLTSRIPCGNDTDAWLLYRPVEPIEPWTQASGFSRDAMSDCVGSATIYNLIPDTRYEYIFRDNSGATLARSHFRTLREDISSFSFASSSCMIPDFPRVSPWERGVVKGARYLAASLGVPAGGSFSGLPTLTPPSAPSFLLFVGDFIYADVPKFFGSALETYHRKYRQVMASADVQSLLQHLPLYSVYDDHEIRNNYDLGGDDKMFKNAEKAFFDYLGASNPSSMTRGENYYAFTHGDAAFFAMDVRKHRSSNTSPDDRNKTMLGAVQKAAFKHWLAAVNATYTFKFVVTSIPFTSLWEFDDDTWGSFLTERDELMDVMQYVPNVVVISGDRHEFAAVKLRSTVHEFSTSPFNMFYLPVRTFSASNGRGAVHEEEALKYIPDGNSKYTLFNVNTTDPANASLEVQVVVDGLPAWNYTIAAVPVHGSSSQGDHHIGDLSKTLREIFEIFKSFSLRTSDSIKTRAQRYLQKNYASQEF